MTASRPLAPRLDDIWGGHKTGPLTTTDAVNQIRALLDVTELGALEMLENNEPPSIQYSAAGRKAATS